MTIETFQDALRFELIGDVVLHDLVLAGQPLPAVIVYRDRATGECYQVSPDARLYRQTTKPSQEHQVLKYGEWTPLR
jgi:hypothetical protein